MLPTRFTPSPRVAIGSFFLLKGFLVGNWIPRIPGIVKTLELSSGELGIVSFIGAAGCLISFAVAAKIVGKHGSASTTWLFSSLFFALYPLLVLAPNVAVYGAGVLLSGFLNGINDVALSVQGGVVERHVRRQIFSSLHGYFSLGALVGSVTGGIAAQLAFPIVAQMAIVALIAIPTIAWMRAALIADDQPAPARARASRRFRLSLPPAVLWPLGALIFCVAVSEEATNNWSALYLRQDLGTSAGVGALVYTCFSITTLTGRLTGDAVMSRFGVERVLRFGSLIAAIGIGAAVLINQPWAVIAGFAIVGLGISVVVPIAYRLAGTMPGISPSATVAGVASLGYSGFLIGPPVIGFMADLLSLRVALGLVTIVLLCIQLLVPHLPSSRTNQAPAPETIDPVLVPAPREVAA